MIRIRIEVEGGGSILDVSVVALLDLLTYRGHQSYIADETKMKLLILQDTVPVINTKFEMRRPKYHDSL